MKKLIILASMLAAAVSVSSLASPYIKVKEEKSTHIIKSKNVANPSYFYGVLGVGYGKFITKADAYGTYKQNKESYMIGLGRQINSQIRVDITFDKNEKSTKENIFGKLIYKSWAVMANIYYHFDDLTATSPYIMGGLGRAEQKIVLRSKPLIITPKFGKRPSRLVYQAGFGISSKMSDRVIFDLGYRYMHFAHLKAPGLTLKPSVHKIMATIRLPL
jgi:opacity protein-like surface antigen